MVGKYYALPIKFCALKIQDQPYFHAGDAQVGETEIRMGAEDFGYYTQQLPGCFYRLGVMNVAKGITSGVHTPTFNIDENAIELGMGMMAWLAISADLTK